jgi:hypothetical protein
MLRRREQEGTKSKRNVYIEFSNLYLRSTLLCGYRKCEKGRGVYDVCERLLIYTEFYSEEMKGKITWEA